MSWLYKYNEIEIEKSLEIITDKHETKSVEIRSEFNLTSENILKKS